jgi:hypothetical protein
MNRDPTVQPKSLTEAEWLEALARCVTPEVEPPVRRDHRRYGVDFGLARLSYTRDGVPLTRTAPLLQISAEGLMVQIQEPIRVYTPLRLEVILGDETFALTGQVAHSTQTVGGYKVGIQLLFPD